MNQWPIIHLAQVDSTNEEIKRRAAEAPTGLTVIADAQTAGKGRLGRSFRSPAGQGLYLSVLLRPVAPPEEISRLTAWSAVATCRALQAVCGLRADIKWPNDVLVCGKKLCGILTERVGDDVIVGIGVNLTQHAADFGPELADKATSLAMLGYAVERDAMAQALVAALQQMNASFPQGKEAYRTDYLSRCVTLGRSVVVIGADGTRRAGEAVGLAEDLSLVVRFPEGEERVSWGEVSVRGLLGYA